MNDGHVWDWTVFLCFLATWSSACTRSIFFSMSSNLAVTKKRETWGKTQFPLPKAVPKCCLLCGISLDFTGHDQWICFFCPWLWLNFDMHRSLQFPRHFQCLAESSIIKSSYIEHEKSENSKNMFDFDRFASFSCTSSAAILNNIGQLSSPCNSFGLLLVISTLITGGTSIVHIHLHISLPAWTFGRIPVVRRPRFGCCFKHLQTEKIWGN